MVTGLTLLQVAKHEASHCLVGWFYGLRVDKVVVCYDPLKDGRQGCCSATQGNELKDAAWVYYVIAGAVLDNSCGDGRGDAELIRDSFRLSKDVLKMHGFFKQNPKADIEDFFQEFKNPVLKILNSRKGKASIKALSDELLKYSILPGQTAVKILEKAWGLPLPEMAMPADQHGKAFTNKINSYDDLICRIRFYLDAANTDIKAFDTSLLPDQERQIEDLKILFMQLRFVLKKEIRICSTRLL